MAPLGSGAARSGGLPGDELDPGAAHRTSADRQLRAGQAGALAAAIAVEDGPDCGARFRAQLCGLPRPG